MNKLFITTILLPLICCSCVSNHKKNSLVEGDFYETDVGSGSSFLLTVKEITKDEYLNAKGLNVVSDITSKNHLYSISFKDITNEYEIIELDFLNLEDKDADSPIFPAIYTDDNGNTLQPATKYTYYIYYDDIYHEMRTEL